MKEEKSRINSKGRQLGKGGEEGEGGKEEKSRINSQGRRPGRNSQDDEVKS